jgi:hypothetical protein
MIDVTTEDLFPLRDAPKRLPGRPSLATCYRWSLAGCRGVRLETVQVGGSRWTSAEAFSRFVATLTAARDGSPPVPQSPAKPCRQNAETARRLDELGI